MVHIHHPETPFEYNVAGEMHPGKHIEIHGKVKHGEHQQFKVELMSGPNVVFHFDPRFGYGGCHELILNSYLGGWGEEERHHNPFHPGDHFDLKIKVKEEKYDIHVNGEELCHYHHRQSPHTIDYIRISGDIKIEDFRFHHH
uniref:Galectin n=1 Tax=Plectus sambesii TaxID=2011161 RepID=A0A914VZY0_9BILA